ncbi:phosphoenolpyruvate carboxylase [Candidatus Micrarchaeota archaeon]|nr:phosphoenolpyruvate carboxylase [Candidatus Micrarchaeota archaeon]
MRRIPKTMGTQHPDNARKPIWAEEAFIDTTAEVEECFRCFADIGAQEFMWDWEGKHVDESVVEKLFTNYAQYFQNNPLGKDLFLTMRLPNIWEEKGYRLSKAFSNLISANQMAEDLGMHAPALFEAILPMTKGADQLAFLQKKFKQIQKAFDLTYDLELIPLVEEPEVIQKTDKVLEEYCKDENPQHIRVFIARSDPALNAGNVTAVLSNKVGLCKTMLFEEKTGVKAYPIIGAGCLLFRGGLNPLRVKKFLEEYVGVHTVTLQSAFRYDYDFDEVTRAIGEIHSTSSKPKAVEDETLVTKVAEVFTREYQQLVESIAGTINSVAAYVPHRRERRLHVGLFGYARKMQGVSLPRAIPFTSALYSLGVPPEFLGVGTALSKLDSAQRDALYDCYKFFEEDLRSAGKYFNRENLHALAHQQGWAKVAEDIRLLEEQISWKFGPEEDEHYIHRNLTSNVRLLMKSRQDVSKEIVRAGELRRSLG